MSVFAVESIIDMKTLNSRKYYLVKWEGFSDEECTWEPANNLKSCSDLIQEFHLLKPKLKNREYQVTDIQFKSGSLLYNEILCVISEDVKQCKVAWKPCNNEYIGISILSKQSIPTELLEQHHNIPQSLEYMNDGIPGCIISYDGDICTVYLLNGVYCRMQTTVIVDKYPYLLLDYFEQITTIKHK